jgi:hypothetical protein
VLLAIVGLAVGISAFAAQRMSNKAVRKLRTLGSSGSPPVVGLSGEEPKCDPAHVSTLTDALAPWHALPWLLIVIWPAIAVVRFIYD